MTLSQRSFDAVAALFARASGIQLTEAKRSLVIGRLQRLAKERGVGDLDAYVAQLAQGEDAAELQRVVDRLTTNETYFFREPAHFDFLAQLVADAPRGGELRVWSAASSSGEEAYSIAMLLADKAGAQRWEVVGTDLSTAMVQAARRAVYPMERAAHVPAGYLKRFCLKGHGPYEGTLRIAPELRDRVRFECANLTRALPDTGQFDVIFLRNVLIYFEPAAKEQIVRRVAERLKPQGYFLTGHAESLGNMDVPLRPAGSAIYVHAGAEPSGRSVRVRAAAAPALPSAARS